LLARRLRRRHAYGASFNFPSYYVSSRQSMTNVTLIDVATTEGEEARNYFKHSCDRLSTTMRFVMVSEEVSHTMRRTLSRNCNAPHCPQPWSRCSEASKLETPREHLTKTRVGEAGPAEEHNDSRVASQFLSRNSSSVPMLNIRHVLESGTATLIVRGRIGADQLPDPGDLTCAQHPSDPASGLTELGRVDPESSDFGSQHHHTSFSDSCRSSH
jgi:hypothetical protein